VAAAYGRQCGLLLLKLLAVAVATARFSDFVRQHPIHDRWHLRACLSEFQKKKKYAADRLLSGSGS
jgi:hypothetical protein